MQNTGIIIAALKKIMMSQQDFLSDLPLASITEDGVLFKTGSPVTFNYLRNTVSSKNFKTRGHSFQQDIEPAGKYMLFDSDPERQALDGWEKGEVTLRSPLVLEWSKTGLYDETSWKFRLWKAFGKKGKALTSKLKTLGFDAIVTVDGNHTSEIVQLI